MDKKSKALRRLEWTNAMVGELLQVRLKDGEVKKKLEAADTKTKMATLRQPSVIEGGTGNWPGAGVMMN